MSEPDSRRASEIEYRELWASLPWWYRLASRVYWAFAGRKYRRWNRAIERMEEK